MGTSASEDRMQKRLDVIAELATGAQAALPWDNDGLGNVQALRMMVQTAEGGLAIAVEEARSRGASWADVARMLGTTRQAAWERYGQ